MLRSSNICSSCRRSLFQRSGPEEWIRTQEHIIRRYRHKSRDSKSSTPLMNFLLDDLKPFDSSEHPPRHPAQKYPNRHRNAPGPSLLREEADVFLPFNRKNSQIPDISLDEVIPYFEENVFSWASAARTKDRLEAFGIPHNDMMRLLDAFVEDVETGLLSEPHNIAYYGLERFSHPHDATSIDIIYSTVFFWWASNPENELVLQEEFRIRPKTIHFIQRLVRATSRQYPADEWPRARAMNRKIIMHVGPTNSGKTHHALRALAAAKSGVYAGPLRLLAHEIWHRLNTGQIIPLGVEEDPKEPRRADGNPEYARLCDMITGEEQKIMGIDVPLLSCTVEMIPLGSQCDVAVIDEIQMIGDRSRGGGWVNAVLGLCAKEIHLCGEETAVPVVEALLRHTGDEVEVRRYERLTPLVVEDQSLNGDLTDIREGDCIVTFSRAKIFELKKLVEARTGMRGAVVYGRLPPEVRSEQASLFNDPKSGYDVLIGSDAIGMGLNLRIKRIIFEAVHKFDEGGKRLLSTSSIKQIGGRAGRYGVHESQADLGGTVTTLYPEDLRHLSRWLSAPYEPLSYAFIQHTPQILHAALSILPPESSVSLGLLAPRYIGRLPPFIRYAAHEHLNEVGSVLDNEWAEMSIEDKLLVLHAPIPWSDKKAVIVIKRMLVIHAQNFVVDMKTAISGQGFLEMMERVEVQMKLEEQEQKKIVSTPTTLMLLESFHKVLVFYLWMSFKNPIVYSDDSVHSLKERAEKVLNWTLEHLSRKSKRGNEAAEVQALQSGSRPEKDEELGPLDEDQHGNTQNLQEEEERLPYEPLKASHNDLALSPAP